MNLLILSSSHHLDMYLWSPLKFVASYATDKTASFLIFLYAPLQLMLMSYTDTVLKYFTLSSLSSENVSTMIPNTMFRPMVVTMMKKVRSKKTTRRAVSLNFVGKSTV